MLRSKVWKMLSDLLRAQFTLCNLFMQNKCRDKDFQGHTRSCGDISETMQDRDMVTIDN